MLNADIRSAWLNEPLEEEAVSEDKLPKALRGQGAHLFLRALTARQAGDAMKASEVKGKTHEITFLANVLAASLRNADEPNKDLVFDVTFVQSLIETKVGPIVDLAKQAVKLSGLDEQAAEAAKNDSTATQGENSPSGSPATSAA